MANEKVLIQHIYIGNYLICDSSLTLPSHPLIPEVLMIVNDTPGAESANPYRYSMASNTNQIQYIQYQRLHTIHDESYCVGTVGKLGT